MLAEEEIEPVQDPLWLTTEAVKASLLGARGVYRTLLNALVSGISSAREEASPENDLFVVAASGLVKKILRAVHGAERSLSHTYSQKVVLSDASVQLGEDFQEVLRQIQSGSV